MKKGCALNILAFTIALSMSMAKQYGLSKEKFLELTTEIVEQCFERLK